VPSKTPRTSAATTQRPRSNSGHSKIGQLKTGHAGHVGIGGNSGNGGQCKLQVCLSQVARGEAKAINVFKRPPTKWATKGSGNGGGTISRCLSRISYGKLYLHMYSHGYEHKHNSNTCTHYYELFLLGQDSVRSKAMERQLAAGARRA